MTRTPYNKVETITREDLLIEKTNKENTIDKVLSVITNYVYQCNDLPNVVKKKWGIVQRSTSKEKAKRYFNEGQGSKGLIRAQHSTTLSELT